MDGFRAVDAGAIKLKVLQPLDGRYLLRDHLEERKPKVVPAE